MKINYQIRDEKLQDDINRKTGEISALSSDKIDKYECLTGKEMLPCNHQQIIAPAKCAFSSLRKAFIKQIKTIEDQGKKQVDALKEEAKVVEEKSGDKLSMQKKIYNRFLKERTSKMQQVSDEINHDNLIYYFKRPSSPTKFY